jgi:peptidoglycan/LPS O-acetylase OafA/YrhL
MVNFKRFYIRRSLRIFPVYYFYLIIVFILQLFTHYHQSALAWFQNISFSTGYQFPSTQYSWTTGHLWSIAVEEQFYIVWPIMFYFFRNNFKQAIILLLTPILLAPFFRVIDYVNNENQGFGWLFPTPQFLSCFDSLATGCICAFFYFKYTCTIHSFYLKNKFILFTLGFLLILIPAILQKQYICGFFTVPFANTSQNLGFAILLLQSIVSPHSIPYNILNKKIMKFIGMLSFSIYIWQQLFTTPSSAFLNQEIYFLKFPWFLGCIFLISIISYYLIEKPFLVLRSKYRITN